MQHTHPVRVYYEDTDFSGLVYHANYLKYCERAREELLGVDRLVALFRDHGTSFVVYKATMTFREGARHGDLLEIRTTARLGSPWRAIFQQNVHRAGVDRPLVEVEIHLACIDADHKLVRLPDDVAAALAAESGG